MDFKENYRIFLLTIKALSTKEKYIVLFLSVIFLLSLFKILISSFGAFSFDSDDKSIYIEGLVGQIAVVNPLFSQANNVDRDISSFIFEGLSKYDPVIAKVVDNEAIATHSLSEDQKTYTFYINKNAKWHDGVPLTADDVIFTYRDVIQNPSFTNLVLKKTFEDLLIEKIDEYTVKFTLKQKNSFFFTSTLVGLIPKHIFEKEDVATLQRSELNQTPVGNGPYQFESIKTSGENSRVFLSKFDQYSGQLPNIDKITLAVFPSFDQLSENLSAINGLARVSKLDIDKINDDRFNLYRYKLPRYTALFMNSDNPLLKNKNIRLAIQKAIDKETLSEILGYEIIDSPILELKSDDWKFKANMEQAKGALFDAGWKIDEKTNLRMNKSGQKLTLRLLTRDYQEGSQQGEINKQTLEFIKESLLELGIDLIIEEYTLNFLQYQILDRDYDLLLYGQSLEYNLDLYPYLHSSQTKDRGLNFSLYRSIRIDQLLEDIRSTFDQSVKEKKLTEIGNILAEDIPAVYLYTPVYYYLVDKNIDIGDLGDLATPVDRFANIEGWRKE